MTKTFKLVSLVGTSPTSYEEAIQNAITDASGSVRNLSWFEVKEMRGAVSKGSVLEYQVKIDVGFRVETEE